ncbi:MAG: Rv1355c family protein [Actinomycetota bacterium]|nr:Rv1355c family protein [Actinomycetota bacterium]
MTTFRYGASFYDRASGLRFEAHHPLSRPDRWRAYLEGAHEEYARYGIDMLANPRALERGEGVPLFFVGVNADDDVVAGLRAHGPLDDPAAAHALAEMAASPEWEEHRAAVEAASPYGVIEIKGAWRKMSGDGNPAIISAMVRCCAHAIEWLGAEVLLAAVADRMEPVMASIGSMMRGTQGAPYPTEQYRTILTSMQRPEYRGLLDEAQARLLREDAEQLSRPPERLLTTGWRPIVLDVRRRSDRQILANLRADPGIDVLDVAERQRTELRRLVPPPSAEAVEEPTRHVYLPWRRSVVHMLGPRGYALLRLDRNRHRITREEQERLARQRVGVVGLSAGHAAAVTIALEGLCGELRVADHDAVEASNLNRLPASILDVGDNKAVVAARRVAELDPYLPVHAFTGGVDPDNVDEFIAGLDVVVEECDDLAMKLLVREAARRQRVAVVMETSDRGMLDVERFDLEPDRPPFHGLLGDVSADALFSLSVTEKVPYVLAIVDAPQSSARGTASLAEIGRTVSTWPQLGSEVTLGGATVAATVRRLGLGDDVPSGRARVDLDAIISSLEPPRPPRTATPAGTAAAWSPPPTDWARAIVHAATLAPSCSNGQPWKFELTSRELALELDSSRSCGTMDVRSRASYVGLGAALFNARVAAASSGHLGPFELFPEGPSSDVVASLELGTASDSSLAELRESMLDRCSNRRLGTPAALDLAVVHRLSSAAAAEHAQLHLLTDRERLQECAEIFTAAERIRFLSPELREETMRELRWPGEDVSTGIDVATLELSGSDASALQLLRRGDVMELLDRWDAGGALGDYLGRAIGSSSAVAVLTVETASPSSYLTGGMALERVWIEAQRAGLAVQAIAPAFLYAVQERDFDSLGGSRWAGDLRKLSERFRQLLDLGTDTVGILTVRLSHAAPPRVRSARLPLEHVLRRRGQDAAAERQSS